MALTRDEARDVLAKFLNSIVKGYTLWRDLDKHVIQTCEELVASAGWKLVGWQTIREDGFEGIDHCVFAQNDAYKGTGKMGELVTFPEFAGGPELVPCDD